MAALIENEDIKEVIVPDFIKSGVQFAVQLLILFFELEKKMKTTNDCTKPV